MNKKIGRPRNEIQKYRTSITAPATFDNTLRIVGYKIPELKGLSTSQQIVMVLEMAARGDLGITEQYRRKTEGISFDNLE
jgi:hypothetical protein